MKATIIKVTLEVNSTYFFLHFFCTLVNYCTFTTKSKARFSISIKIRAQLIIVLSFLFTNFCIGVRIVSHVSRVSRAICILAQCRSLFISASFIFAIICKGRIQDFTKIIINSHLHILRICKYYICTCNTCKYNKISRKNPNTEKSPKEIEMRRDKRQDKKNM